MKQLIFLIALELLLFNCRQTNYQQKEQVNKIEFNQKLADELNNMAEIDQIAAYTRQGKFKDWTIERWSNFKDSVFTTQLERLARRTFGLWFSTVILTQPFNQEYLRS
jgi:hypothetical protein